MFLGLGLDDFYDSGLPQNKNHEIHLPVVQNQSSTKRHRKYQLEVPGVDFLRFWGRFRRPGGVVLESLGASVPKVIFNMISGLRRTSRHEKSGSVVLSPSA